MNRGGKYTRQQEEKIKGCAVLNLDNFSIESDKR